MQQLTLAIVLFVLTYVLLLTMPKYRAYIALGSALLYIATKQARYEHLSQMRLK